MADNKPSRRPTETPNSVQPIQVNFSDDLSEYIRTDVDPTGRYAKQPTRKEKLGFALIYVFIIVLIVIGLLGGVGQRVLEGLLR